MMTSFRALAAVGFGALVLLPSGALASIFSNFGPGQSYGASVGDSVGNYFDGNNYAEGSLFTPTATATFGSLQIALSCAFLCPDTFTVALDRDNGDQPGAAIESFVVSGAVLGTFGDANSPLVLDSVLQPTLTAGTQYWLTVANASGNDSIEWNLNTTGDTSDQAISTDGGTTWFSPSGQTPGAYEVDSSALVTPEPGSTGLLIVGLSFLFLMRRFASRRTERHLHGKQEHLLPVRAG